MIGPARLRATALAGLVWLAALASPAAADWSNPVELSLPGGSALWPDVAVDAQGDAVAVWPRHDGSDYIVQARRLPAGGPPGPIVDLSAPGADGLSPRVGVSPQGDATVVWEQDTGPGWSVQARRLPAGGAPGPILELSTAGETVQDPRVAVDAAGDATAAWAAHDGTSFVVQGRSLPAAGGTGAIVDLSLPGQSAQRPEVAVNAQGHVIVVWDRQAATAAIVQARRMAEGAAFGPPVDVSAEGGVNRPHVAIDAQGDATVVWWSTLFGDRTVHARRLPALAFPGPILDLSAPGALDPWPRVAVDAAGDAVAVWEGSAGTSGLVVARAIPESGPLGAVVELSGVSGDALEQQVAVDALGVATVIWRRLSGGSYVVEARRIAADGAVGATTELSAPGQVLGPQVAAGPQGAATAVWSRTGVVEAVRFTEPAPPPPPAPPPAADPPAPAPPPATGPPAPAPPSTLATPPVADTSVAIRIAGRRLRVGRRGVVRVRLRCPRAERSSPCRGRVTLQSRRAVRFRGERRRIRFDRMRFSIPAGSDERVRLRLSRRETRLVRRSRRAVVTVRVRDAAGNRATARRRMRLALS